MAEIIELLEICFEGDDKLVVEALVADAVVTHPATYEDPEEYGPAVCRGTMYFPEEALIPATDADLRQLLEESVTDWEPIMHFD